MKKWSSLFTGLGLVGIVFGLVSVFLLLAGAPTDLRWIFANFLLGAILLGIGIVSGFENVRERLASGEARRAGKYGTSAVLSTLFGLLIIALLAFLSTRYHVRLDWSEAKVHSLSDQTRKILDGLDQDVEVIAFYAPLDAPPVREMLDRYAYESDRFQVTFADPNARPDLVQRYAVTPESLSGGLVRVAIGDESTEVTEISEENLTNALVKLTRTGEKKVYFLEGHGERPIEGGESDAEPGWFSRAADALRNENYQVESLLLAVQGEVPDDADAVLLAGPTRPLLEIEHRALERYLRSGGALLVLIDPRANTDLYGDLESWGVELGEDVVIDMVRGLFGQATSPLAGQYANHEITRDLRDPTMFHVARSVRARPGATDRFVEIVLTSENSWAERNLEERPRLGADDQPGPIALAVAGSPRLDSGSGDGTEGENGPDGKGEARLVVFGDADFASNQLIDAYRNRDLFVNAVNWLLGDVEAISIRPERSRASRLQLTTEQLSNIRYLSLFLLPEAIAILGVFAWWWRRRAPGR
jgi:ABC-type uncharacterized transport system involved in gliding motility auxiliary subunit